MNDTVTQNELASHRILIAGAGGQVGIALQQSMPVGVELLALNSNDLNITDVKIVKEVVTQFKPDWIINAAAYTAVDKAESEADLAFLVNSDGAANLAIAANSIGARMVQISTDYVFDGTGGKAYKPDDAVNPLNVYGESKLAGEIAARDILGEKLLVLRTAWVYAMHGNNFLTTMLRLMRERDEIKVVEDQIGTPTSAFTLASVILSAIKNEVTGTHHWTDAGVASWYDFANAIYDLAISADLLKNTCRITPISSIAYPAPAKRPVCSLLDKHSFRECLGEDGMSWRMALQQMFDIVRRENLSV